MAKHALYTDEEKAIIRDNTLSNAEVAERLGRTPAQVRGIRHYYRAKGQEVTDKRCKYSDEDMAVICDRTLTNQEVADRLGKTLKQVMNARWHRGVTGYPRATRRSYTDADIEMLRDTTISNAEVAERLGKTTTQIRKIRAYYGITGHSSAMPQKGVKKCKSKEEILEAIRRLLPAIEEGAGDLYEGEVDGLLWCIGMRRRGVIKVNKVQVQRAKDIRERLRFQDREDADDYRGGYCDALLWVLGDGYIYGIQDGAWFKM